MQTNLPPLMQIYLHEGDDRDERCIVADGEHSLDADQAALVIDIVEARYPKLVRFAESMERLAQHQFDIAKDTGSTSLFWKMREDAKVALASLESK